MKSSYAKGMTIRQVIEQTNRLSKNDKEKLDKFRKKYNTDLPNAFGRNQLLHFGRR